MDLPDADAAAYLGQPGITAVEPPACPAGQAHRMQGGEWVCAIDRRGEVWHHPGDREQQVIHEVGFTPPAGWVAGPLPPIIPTAAEVLERTRLIKWEKIKAARSSARDVPLVTAYGTFDCDKASRDNIADAIAGMEKAIALGATDSITWTLADNSNVTLTLAQLTVVGVAALSQVQGAHQVARVLREDIWEAETVEDVQAIAWPVSP